MGQHAGNSGKIYTVTLKSERLGLVMAADKLSMLYAIWGKGLGLK